ncbi:hypothetical protein N431DRAFT_225765 [Stipitochalara longipes BDJ]|nr:hypothetical protein N431DRAFT_225765 [Stipitochalara longipes BDJ]
MQAPSIAPSAPLPIPNLIPRQDGRGEQAKASEREKKRGCGYSINAVFHIPHPTPPIFGQFHFPQFPPNRGGISDPRRRFSLCKGQPVDAVDVQTPKSKNPMRETKEESVMYRSCCRRRTERPPSRGVFREYRRKKSCLGNICNVYLQYRGESKSGEIGKKNRQYRPASDTGPWRSPC